MKTINVLVLRFLSEKLCAFHQYICLGVCVSATLTVAVMISRNEKLSTLLRVCVFLCHSSDHLFVHKVKY